MARGDYPEYYPPTCNELEAEISRLRAENAQLFEYKRKYEQLLHEGVKQGEHMVCTVLNACLDPTSNIHKVLRKE